MLAEYNSPKWIKGSGHPLPEDNFFKPNYPGISVGKCPGGAVLTMGILSDYALWTGT